VSFCPLKAALFTCEGLPMPRTKAKPVAQAGRTTKRPVIQKSAIQKPVIHRAVTEREITRKNIVAALQKAARKLGRTPSKREFAELSGRSKYQIIRYFQTYRTALAAAGMMPNQSGRRIEMAVLMTDWGNVARKVGGVPSNQNISGLEAIQSTAYQNAFKDGETFRLSFADLWLLVDSRAIGAMCWKKSNMARYQAGTSVEI
jgi:hypothetical protein